MPGPGGLAALLRLPPVPPAFPAARPFLAAAGFVPLAAALSRVAAGGEAAPAASARARMYSAWLSTGPYAQPTLSILMEYAEGGSLAERYAYHRSPAVSPD